MSKISNEIEDEESIVIGEEESMRLSYLSNLEQEFYNKPYKEYSIQLKRGTIVHKRIKYTNVHKRVLLLKAITDQPNLIQFKSQNNQGMIIEINQSDFLRFKFTPPNNPCIIIARIALLDHLDTNQVANSQENKSQFAINNLKQKMLEGLEFRVEII
ncbi:hypothetical protein ABPG72_004882 [Tetrahymena utriculariae]